MSFHEDTLINLHLLTSKVKTMVEVLVLAKHASLSQPKVFYLLTKADTHKLLKTILKPLLKVFENKQTITVLVIASLGDPTQLRIIKLPVSAARGNAKTILWP